MRIGVFDSGIGGLSVTNAIKKAIPAATVIYVSDHAHMPYGDKPPAEVFGYVLPLLEQLEQDGCEAIVIACNTVTTHHIAALRERLHVPLVGIEPMVKPAAERTKTGIIAVCATPATLASQRYTYLKETYAKNVMVIEPDCSRWAYMIEHKQVDEAFITQQIESVCAQGADVIVLGCTHYHWIEQEIKTVAANRAQILQPEAAVITQLKRVLAQQP